MTDSWSREYFLCTRFAAPSIRIRFSYRCLKDSWGGAGVSEVAMSESCVGTVWTANGRCVLALMVIALH